MIKTFTQTDLIRYLYHETTEEESREIEAALLCDDALREQYTALVGMKKELDEVVIEPSEQVVERILSYVRRKTTANH